MLFFIGLNTSFLCPRKRSSIFGRCASRRTRVFAALLIFLSGSLASAQERSTASHGKTWGESANPLLRDVHPASQAWANYLQNIRYLQVVRKEKWQVRWDRLDAYDERLAIQRLKVCQNVAQRLAGGRPTLAKDLPPIWAIVSVFGDRAEVYDALSSNVPPMTHDDFESTTIKLDILMPSGELVRPPMLLEAIAEIDGSALETAWNELATSIRASGRPMPREVGGFRECVADYCQQASASIKGVKPTEGRGPADRYLKSLECLADAFYRPQESDQIQAYLAQGGYAYYGGSMLGFVQHMLKNRVTPAQGSTAQVTLAELARPISRVLEQEIALHWERIDSLAANEGHRPYAAEYRGNEEPFQPMPGRDITQTEPAAEPGI
jgi:hypothetical protein